ncbi:MAG: hypothetical protein JNN12_03905 [Bacteroidetes Order II. Incertae sedis bacterium]|nr:hypothetical protein [Bacteroidetes Order II. bacterium]
MKINSFQQNALTEIEASEIKGGIHFQLDRKGIHLNLSDPSKFTYRVKPPIGFFIRNWGALRPHVKAISGVMLKELFPNPFKLFRSYKGEINLGSVLGNLFNPTS